MSCLHVLLLVVSTVFSEPTPTLMPTPTILDEVAAVVDNEVITSLQMEREIRLTLALREGPASAVASLAQDVWRLMRGYVLNQRLVALEVRKLGGVNLSEQDVTARCTMLVERFDSHDVYMDFLTGYGLSEASVRMFLRRDLENNIFLRDRLRLHTAESESDRRRNQEAMERFLKTLRSHVRILLADDSGELQQMTNF